MKQTGKNHHPFGKKYAFAVSVGISLLMAATAYGASAQGTVHQARTLVRKDVPVMMLSLPGRGVLMSPPGDIATVVIENGADRPCSTYLARTDKAGILEVPVARTTHCHSPRIVVYR